MRVSSCSGGAGRRAHEHRLDEFLLLGISTDGVALSLPGKQRGDVATNAPPTVTAPSTTIEPSTTTPVLLAPAINAPSPNAVPPTDTPPSAGGAPWATAEATLEKISGVSPKICVHRIDVNGGGSGTPGGTGAPIT